MALAPATMFAQESLVEAPADASRVEVGDTVRVGLPRGRPVQAVFQGWSSDIMLLQVEGMAMDWPVSIFDMARLEVRTARTRREGLRHYAVVGAVAGLFVGAGVGLALHSTGISADPDGPAEQIVMTTLRWAGLGTIGGFVSGGLLGGRHPGVGWISLALPVGNY
ncbi:MAG: hypothetical protein ACPHWZ_08580 [Longimicrobiales bacterium]